MTLDLSLKSRVHKFCCLNDKTVKVVKVVFDKNDLTGPWHVLVKHIADAWNISVDSIANLKTAEVSIEDEYDVVQLTPKDVITFCIV